MNRENENVQKDYDLSLSIWKSIDVCATLLIAFLRKENKTVQCIIQIKKSEAKQSKAKQKAIIYLDGFIGLCM